MKGLRLFDVSPRLPEELKFLETLSSNLWWSWNEDAKELFRRVDFDLWSQSGNPLVLLRRVGQPRLQELVEDPGFLAHLEQVQARFRHEVLDLLPESDEGQIAYFSLEHGIHESVRLYSGGLGVLAGDHLKASSDLGLPIVALGLLYHQGYFEQSIDEKGWQQETYPTSDLSDLPIRRAEREGENRQLIVSLPLPEGELKAAVWRLDVGRVPLYLLSSDISENPEPFRQITRRLYSADKSVRLRQELLLGIGGRRALDALGIHPSVHHLNEGHAAFLNLARVESLMRRHDLDADTAREVVRRTTVFTTHTPVPAGNETFKRDLLMPHLEALRHELKLDPAEVLRTGQAEQEVAEDQLSMTVLGMRYAQYRNGVSRLHGEVARSMWAHLWPNHLEHEIPIGHITNGVHVPTWIYRDLDRLYEMHLGSDWKLDLANQERLDAIDRIPEEELFQAHERARSSLIRGVRRHMEKSYRARSASPREVAGTRTLLTHGRLTIGFARRAATYKRLTLLLHDPERLEALLTDEERPIQFLFAAKAHPADHESKALIQQLMTFARRHEVRRHIVFLENYDMRIAAQLVRGVDVWLNNPRRPQEASGTSGMKAAINGVLNASILDGWWEEAYTPEIGWAFGRRETPGDSAYQDALDAQALYNLLEEDIAPCFYDRGENEVPVRWVKMMKASIRTALGRFTTHRMVREYADSFYTPAAANHKALLANGASLARELLGKHQLLEERWGDVRISPPLASRSLTDLHVGDTFSVAAQVHLGRLSPEEVVVQIYSGAVDREGRIRGVQPLEMSLASSDGDRTHRYSTTLSCTEAGRHGFTVRVLPRGADWQFETPGFLTWSETD